MSTATASNRRDAAKPIDDFEWPPTADELSVYEMGPDPWQKLQDASGKVFVARRRELSQPRPQRTPERVAERAPLSTRKRAGGFAGLTIGAGLSIGAAWTIGAGLVIVAVAAGWVLYAVMTRPVPVQVVHHPAPAAAVTTPPRPITIVATYPVEPDPSTTTPAGREPATNGAATARPDDSRMAETTPAVFEALAPAGAPAAVARADTPDAGIRSLLQRYEEAYDRRDVSAAAALWPSVDETALARTFAALDRQDVHFERCDINASEARGAAVCVGTVRYVARAEGAVEKEGRITWTFELARSGEDWRIAGLSAR